MQIQIFSIYDAKAEAFIQPFYSPTKAVGIRNFAHAANNPDSEFYKFAGDYTLFHIGTFDSDTGLIEQNPTHENLGLAITHQSPSDYKPLVPVQGGE